MLRFLALDHPSFYEQFSGLFFVVIQTDDLKLHIYQQRGQRTQGGQHGCEDRYHTTDGDSRTSATPGL